MQQVFASGVLGEDDHACAGHVVMQIPSLLILQSRGIVHFNLESGAVKVELLAVAGHAKTEARTAGDFGRLALYDR